jgi:hypothetical protein
MPVTLSDEQAKNWAASLRSMANTLDPPVVPPEPTPTPTPAPAPSPTPIPGSGGTVVLGNFTGRSQMVDPYWKRVFEDDFPFLAAEGGEFLTKYSKWSAYPNYFPTTNKLGLYEPKLLSVKAHEDGSGNYLNCRLRPKSAYPDGKSRSTAAYPRYPGQTDASSVGAKWEMRFRVPVLVPKWHAANLGWPIPDDAWPERGENDFWEQQLDGDVGCFFHLDGATSGGDQVHFSGHLMPNTWNVLGFEWIPGKSYAWFLNGKEIFGDGKTARLTSRVPNWRQRIVLQLEDGGTPTQECNVQYDWVTAWIPA